MEGVSPYLTLSDEDEEEEEEEEEGEGVYDDS